MTQQSLVARESSTLPLPWPLSIQIPRYSSSPQKAYGSEKDCPSAREVFAHIESVKILVILDPTSYMLTSSSGFCFIL